MRPPLTQPPNENSHPTMKLTRRKVLAATASAALLAGCAGTDDEEAEYSDANGTDDGNGDAEELPDEDEIENRPEGEDHLVFGGLELTEYDLVVEQGDFRDEIYVEGVVENTDDEMFDYVDVSVRAYDAEGRHLDRYFTNTTDLGANTEWVFEVSIREDLEDFEDFDIAVTGSQY